MRRLFSILSGLVVALSIAVAPVAAGGPPALSFYVDGARYRTIGTPTDFSGTGAPAHSFETIYALGPGLINVAEAAPGQPGFRGGRWAVTPVTWHVPAYQLTSNEEVEALAEVGDLTIESPIKWFECPVIPVGGKG